MTEILTIKVLLRLLLLNFPNQKKFSSFFLNDNRYLSSMNMKRIFLAAVLFCFSTFAWSQGQTQKEKQSVTFEQLYDEPFSINKFFIGFQPLYGEVFATNPNAGFGIEASYYYKDKFDVKASIRRPYSSQFFDGYRQLALEDANAPYMNTPTSFGYYELGVTYHFKDFDQESKTKMVLYKKSFKGDRWASTVPLHAEVPCKVRKIYGARLGGILWSSSTDLNRALKAQGLSFADLTRTDGQALPDTYTDVATGLSKNLNAYGNIHTFDVFVGGSLTWIRNIAVSFDKYDEGVDDGILTVFFDFMFAPTFTLDPVLYKGDQYTTSALKYSSFGVRAGIDGKFNRTLGWSYGGEVGYRPSLESRGFYAMFKIAFPLFSTNLDYKVESFGK